MSDPTAGGVPAPAPEEGVAVATIPSPEEKAQSQEVAKIGIGDLPPALRASIAAAKMANVVVSEIAKLSWGKTLDASQARAVAQWGRDYNVDVTTEMDWLGGRPYLNHKFYLRKLAGLIERGLVEYAVADHIERDSRLDVLAKDGVTDAQTENNRRAIERIRHQIPEIAVSAVVFRVKLRSMVQEVTGAKWAGGRGTNANGKLNDPIGEQFPVETAESRAARRCIRHLTTHVPHLEAEVQKIEGAMVEIESTIEGARKAVEADVAEHRKALGHGIDSDKAQDSYGR